MTTITLTARSENNMATLRGLITQEFGNQAQIGENQTLAWDAGSPYQMPHERAPGLKPVDPATYTGKAPLSYLAKVSFADVPEDLDARMRAVKDAIPEFNQPGSFITENAIVMGKDKFSVIEGEAQETSAQQGTQGPLLAQA